MAYIDLHTHSTASDGTLTPSEVVKTAADAGLSVIALTDHDTVAGVVEAIEAAKAISADGQTAIRVIPGIELSCHSSGKEVHMLGFFLDYKDEEFLKTLEDLRDNRGNRNQKMLDAFVRDGFPITWEKLKHGNPDTVITRAHFARVLVEEGICKTKNEAFDKYLGDGKKYYIPRSKIRPVDAIEYIHKAGGVAVLAHPYEYKLSKLQLITMIEELKDAGLDGIECFHSNNYVGQSLQLKEYAHKYDLSITGGSDFHGENKPDISLGTGRGGLKVHESLVEALEARKK
ncbi:MAG: PHP domain-containing protein [Lachnospiraceae bacterium]|nr:PHP domain-containing protein [Lachnospiraceae bacterium]